MKIINTEHKPHLELVANDAEWDALKSTIKTFLQTNATKSTILIADVRALDSKLSNERVWNQISSEMELIEVPEIDE